MLGRFGAGIGRRLSASTLTIPSSDSVSVSVPFTRLASKLLVEVTKKVWPTGPSSDPWT